MNSFKEDLFTSLVKSGRLRVDDDGLIFRKFKKGWRSAESLTPYIYRVVRVCVDGTCYQMRSHRLVWILANGGIPEGFEINHIDGDRSNNKLANLEIVTGKDNMRHASKLGRMGRKRLKPDQVIRIRGMVRLGYRYRDIATEYGMTFRAIEYIAIGKTWRNIIAPPSP